MRGLYDKLRRVIGNARSGVKRLNEQLLAAAAKGDTPLCCHLLERGADANAVDQHWSRFTALHLAVKGGIP